MTASDTDLTPADTISHQLMLSQEPEELEEMYDVLMEEMERVKESYK